MLVTSNMVPNVACSYRNCSYQSLFAVIPFTFYSSLVLQADFALQLFNNLIPCCPTCITVKPRYHLIFFIEFHSPLQISRITDALFFLLFGVLTVEAEYFRFLLNVGIAADTIYIALADLASDLL